MPNVLLPWAQQREPVWEPGRLRRGAVVVACLAFVVLPITAHSQVSTASLSIQVVGESDERLPGVTVEVLNTETGLKRSGISDEGGVVQIQALPPGTYEIAAQLEGMITPASEVFQLMVGQRAQVTVVLQPRVTDAIEVRGAAPLVDVHRMDSSTNIIPEQIEELPVPDRQYERLALVAPGTGRSRGEYLQQMGSPVLGAGTATQESTYLVDGMDVTDLFFSMSRVRISQDAVSEFRVINQRFDAEIGGSPAGAISVITKSGTNSFTGSAFGFYRADGLRETGALEEGDLPYSRYHLGFTLGGAIRRDKTHYFVSAEHMDEDDIALFRPGGDFVDQAQDFPHPRSQTMALLSITHQFSRSNNGEARLSYERYREDNYQVGGVQDESNGWGYNRDNLNLLLGNTWLLDAERFNEFRLQYSSTPADWPKNSDRMEERFSSGATLITGRNFLGKNELDTDYFEIQDTFHWRPSQSHNLKSGLSYRYVSRTYVEERFDSGLMVYLTDDRSLPLFYLYGELSSRIQADTSILGAFIQDDWSARENLTFSLGLRYDIDFNGNNPDFQHPLVTDARRRDTNDFQPRFSFSWDISNNGVNVLRGGIGRFNGRYFSSPAFYELQFNGSSGRFLGRNLNGRLLGLPPAFWLDPDDPANTGVPVPPDIYLLEDGLQTPETDQLTVGFSRRLGATGLFLDLEAIYSEGKNLVYARDTNFGGNDSPVWLNPDYTWIITYNNDGRSRYKALVLGLNGTIRGGHLITASFTTSDKENIADSYEWSFPSDPADVDAEWGYSGTHEGYRLVASGVFRLPWQVTLAPVFEYGTGRPWNRILGYDYNGDFWVSDRPAGVPRNSEDGPPFRQLDLRISKAIPLREGASIEAIVDIFNVFNTTNYDVTSVDTYMFLQGPTLSNPEIPYVPNPGFASYRATLSPREIQLGLRYRF